MNVVVTSCLLRFRYKSAEKAAAAAGKNTGSGDAQAGAQTQGNQQSSGASGDPGPIRATPPMWRCSKIMHMQRDIHPTVLCSLEGIVDQMVWFRESWYEEVLRQLRQGLAKCYAIAFEHRDSVNEAKITPHIFNFVKKLVSTFGIGVENIASGGASRAQPGSATPSANAPAAAGGRCDVSAASESLARRAEATYQDPVFQEMKVQFTGDFSFSQPGSLRLHNLIAKLKKWIRILEQRSKLLQARSFLIEEKCRYLSNFSLKTAEVILKMLYFSTGRLCVCTVFFLRTD